MTAILRGDDIAYDLYPAADPKDGTRIRRLTSLQKGTYARREKGGTGGGTIVMPADSDDAEAIDASLMHYIKVERKGAAVALALSAAADDTIDTAAAHGLVVGDKLEFISLTGGAGLSTTPTYYVAAVPTSTSLKVATTKTNAMAGTAINFTTDITAGSLRKLTTQTGIFLYGGQVNLLTENGQKPLVLTGPGPLYYLQRAVPAPHSYIGDDPYDGIYRLDKQTWMTFPQPGDQLGAMFNRIVNECIRTQADDPGDQPDSPSPNANDRLVNVLPALTLTFNALTDSAGAAWAAWGGEFHVQVAIENLLDVAMRFLQAGLELDMDPDQFELSAYNPGTLGVDRTGASWGADVVRFVVPSDAKVGTGNILATAKRKLAALIRRSLIWAGGADDIWGVARDNTVAVPWEGGYSSEAADETAANIVAQAQLSTRNDAGDVPRLPFKVGDDPANGLYLPGRGGHFDAWDSTTLHSGTGKWDWNEQTVVVAAMEWRLRDDEAGEHDSFVEFGSTFTPLDQDPSFVGGGGCKCGPTLRLCDTPAAETVESSTDWKVVAGEPPVGWLEPAYDDSGAASPVAITSGLYYNGTSGRWIWIGLPDGGGLRPPEEIASFRGEFTLTHVPQTAVLTIAADNGADYYINGQLVASLGTRFQSPPTHFDTATQVTIGPGVFREGVNCIAVVGWNQSGPDQGSAAIYATLALTYNRTPKAQRCGFHDWHGELGGRTAPDQHPASAVSEPTDGDVQTAIDKLRRGERAALSPAATIAATKSASNPTLNIAGAMPENVVRVGTRYWMVYTRRATNRDVRLAYSDIGPEGPWADYGSNPILTLGSQGWENANTVNGACLLELDGTFHLFYASDIGSGTPGIGHATAETVTGPYTKDDANPVVSPGGSGSWDERRVQEPSVIYVDGTWVMTFMGESMTGVQGESEKVGIATATHPSGPWTKAAGNPVIGFGSAGEFDATGAADPSIFYEGGYWWLLYSGLAGASGGKPWSLGLAYARTADGAWTKLGQLLDVGASGDFDELAVWRGAIYREGSTYYLVYGGIPAGNDTTQAKGGNAILSVVDGEQTLAAHETSADPHPQYLLVDEAAANGLDDLSDVTVSSPAEGDTVRYDGSGWINSALRWEPVVTATGSGPELVFTETDIVMTWADYS